MHVFQKNDRQDQEKEMHATFPVTQPHLKGKKTIGYDI